MHLPRLCCLRIQTGECRMIHGKILLWQPKCVKLTAVNAMCWHNLDGQALIWTPFSVNSQLSWWYKHLGSARPWVRTPPTLSTTRPILYFTLTKWANFGVVSCDSTLDLLKCVSHSKRNCWFTRRSSEFCEVAGCDIFDLSQLFQIAISVLKLDSSVDFPSFLRWITFYIFRRYSIVLDVPSEFYGNRKEKSLSENN